MRETVDRAESGLIDAALGGGVFKLRIARKGGGRSRGYRTIVLLRQGELAFFVHGYAKSSRSNVRTNEVKYFRRMARDYLPLDSSGLAGLLSIGRIIEVKPND